MKPATDSIGTIFGNVLVLGKSREKVKNTSLMICQCLDCGNVLMMRLRRLRRGRVRNCGCR